MGIEQYEVTVLWVGAHHFLTTLQCNPEDSQSKDPRKIALWLWQGERKSNPSESEHSLYQRLTLQERRLS